MDKLKVAAVIPCYRVADTIKDIVEKIPRFVDYVFIVDDHCPQNSGKIVEDLKKENVSVIFHQKNQGVGGAVISGYLKALEQGFDIVVKIDGDGQHDPEHIPRLIEPLIKNEADYVKGNRFVNFNALKTMPTVRLVGNSLLSFLVKIFSGYWNIMDPTNGFTAIHTKALSGLKLKTMAKDYFFESHMLLNLNLINAVVKDVPIRAKYGNEVSSMRMGNVLMRFPPRLIRGLFKRILFKYFIYDFNMASVYLLLGLPMLLWGIGFGVWQWLESISTGIPRTAGTIMVSALPLILAVEMILQAINIDIHNIPKK